LKNAPDVLAEKKAKKKENLEKKEKRSLGIKHH
jgi:hypothetical protein